MPAWGKDLWRRALESARRIPRAAWLCALVAIISAACWSVLTPPFQVVDEPSHFAYTQQLAENHAMPTSSELSFSEEEEAVLHDTHQYEVRQAPEIKPISSAAEQRRLEQALAQRPSRSGEGGVGGAYNDPPLYYALQAIPYTIASSGTLLDQLEAMRLLGALMAGVTALFTFLFIREALPSRRWAWTVGALSVSLAPLLGFMSGADNPDSMLTAVAAVSFYGLARGFHRDFTRGLAAAIGGVLAIGFLTKLNFVGLVPGIVLGLVLLSVRASRTQGRAAYVSLALSLGIATAPVWVYLLLNLASGHETLGIISKTLGLKGAHGSIFDKLSYVWQFYLPRLPGMKDYFPGVWTTRDLWFNRGVGYYGWLDTAFPAWVQNAAIVPAVVLAGLFVRGLVAGRVALRARLGEVAVYAVMALGLLALVGLTSYIYRSEGAFAEPRYLLPLLPLLGLMLAIAARGAGRRLGVGVGTAIVLLFLAHDLFSQLLVAGRFYG
jgi:4-amino-4-deoxy-L-arabinose transferase-like glycosyltransferase